MSNQQGFFTDGSEIADRIALHDVNAPQSESIGDLVSSATNQLTSLVHSEIELAKAEITASAKRGAIGGGLFGAAGVIVLYSSFFFFGFVAALLALWMPLWASLLIVFVAMLLVAGLLALIGFKQIKQVKAPERTINSVNELKSLVPGQGPKESHGLYT